MVASKKSSCRTRRRRKRRSKIDNIVSSTAMSFFFFVVFIVGTIHTMNRTTLMMMVTAVAAAAVEEEVGGRPRSFMGRGGEKATLTIPAFSTDDNFRQSFCDRYDRIHDDDTRINSHPNITLLQNVLSGTQLNVLLNSESDYFNYDAREGIHDRENLPGIHADILDYIAAASNFTWRESFGLFYYQDITANETFTDLLEWGVETYDIVIDYWAPSTQRITKEISFCSPYLDGSMILIQKTVPVPAQQIPWGNWFRPFTRQVWFVTLATIVVSALVYPCIEYIGGEIQVFTVRKWLTGRLYWSFITFTGNYAYEPKTLGGCIFGFVFAFWSMLMLAAYTANLATMLVVERSIPTEVINTIDDAIFYEKTMCVPQYTYAHEYVQRKYPQAQSYFVLVPDIITDQYNALNNGECEILIGRQQEFYNAEHQQRHNPECKLKQDGRIIEPLGYAFATKMDPGYRCSLLVNEVFNYYIKQMEETGKLQELWSAHVQNYADPGHCDNNRNTLGGDKDGKGESNSRQRYLKSGGAAGAVVTETSTDADTEQLSLSLPEMAGTFLLQFAGSLFAILATIVSYFEHKYHTRRKIDKRNRQLAVRRHKQSKSVTSVIVHSSHDTSGSLDDSVVKVVPSCVHRCGYNNDDGNNETMQQPATDAAAATTTRKDTGELLHINSRLNNLQSSHDEMKYQLDTVITILENI